MRLLIVAQTASPHTPKWAEAFAARGDDVLVVSQTCDPIARTGPSREDRAGGSLTLEFFPRPGALWAKLPREKYGGGWSRWLAGYPSWQRIVRGFRPDIVHVHFLTADVRNRFYYSKRLVDRLVVSSWGSDVVFDAPPEPSVAANLTALLGRADRVTATTRFLAEETRRFMKPRAGQPSIEVIGFGVDTELFHPPEPLRAEGPEGTQRIGWAKSLEKKYGTEELVAAFRILKGRFERLELRIAGSGSQEAAMRRAFSDAGIDGSVTFLGRLSPEGVARMLREVDVFWMPSICRESFGVAALEASAAGVPVVASNCGGIPEAVIDGQTGLLVPPRDPLRLAEATASLLEDPDRRAELSRAGREFVSRTFPWARSVEEMAAVYDSLLSRT